MMLRRAVDAALALAFVLLMATAGLEEFAHEYLGMAAFALVVVHIALNRRWLAGLRRGRFTALRSLRVAATAGAAASVVALAASSIVLSRYALGFFPAVPGASWAREVHFIASFWGFVPVFLHVGLQLGPMVARVGRALAAVRHLSVGVLVSAIGYDLARVLRPRRGSGRPSQKTQEISR